MNCPIGFEKSTGITKEYWIPVLQGAYAVSNLARVRRQLPGRRTYPGKVLTQIKLAIGYYSVCPVINGKNKTTLVHHLVARAFLGKCPIGKEVNHKDGNKLNNVPSNLEYVTHKENSYHALNSGLIRGKRFGDLRNQARALAKDGMNCTDIVKQLGIATQTVVSACHDHKFDKHISAERVVQARVMRANGMSVTEISKELGISDTAISNICAGDTHKAAGGPITPRTRTVLSTELKAAITIASRTGKVKGVANQFGVSIATVFNLKRIDRNGK